MNTLITHNGKEIPVLGEFAEKAITSPIFISWINNINQSFILHSIKIQSLDTTHSGSRVIFIKIIASVTYPGGSEHNTVIFLRGNAVVILPVLICNSKRYALLVKQARLPVGQEIFELLAGMMDGLSDPKEVILRELEEEANFVSKAGIVKDDIRQLSSKGIMSSPGILDECTFPFFLEKEISKELFDSLDGSMGGLEEEGEQIRVKIVPYEDIANYCTDSKTLATLYLYEHR